MSFYSLFFQVRSLSSQDLFSSPANMQQGTRPRFPSTSTPNTNVQEQSNVTRGGDNGVVTRITRSSARYLSNFLCLSLTPIVPLFDLI